MCAQYGLLCTSTAIPFGCLVNFLSFFTVDCYTDAIFSENYLVSDFGFCKKYCISVFVSGHLV